MGVTWRATAAVFLAATLAPAASAGIVLSQAVIDIDARTPVAQDIEVWNNGSEVAYVVAEPSEIVAPGLPTEQRVRIADPAANGLLVSPQRLILQPGERKLVRVAAIAARPAVDRVYRVTIKPVAGTVTADTTALKLLIGYDVLVLYRPETLQTKVTGTRDGSRFTLRNDGNTSVELYQGKQCQGAALPCTPLPARRVYAGQAWQQILPAAGGTISYRIATGPTTTTQNF